MDLPDMEVEIQVGVGHPVRMVEPEWHLDEAAAQRFQHAHQRGVLGIDGREWVVVRTGPLEDHQPRDMSEGCRRLHVQKRRVYSAELLHERLPSWSASRLRRAA